MAGGRRGKGVTHRGSRHGCSRNQCRLPGAELTRAQRPRTNCVCRLSLGTRSARQQRHRDLGDGRRGDIALIAHTGDLMDIDDGPSVNLQTISELWFAAESGNADGRASGFNDLGQLAFMARTCANQTASSGIFVSDAVAIPEPSVLYLLAAGILTRCQRGRRQVRTVSFSKFERE